MLRKLVLPCDNFCTALPTIAQNNGAERETFVAGGRELQAYAPQERIARFLCNVEGGTLEMRESKKRKKKS